MGRLKSLEDAVNKGIKRRFSKSGLQPFFEKLFNGGLENPEQKLAEGLNHIIEKTEFRDKLSFCGSEGKLYYGRPDLIMQEIGAVSYYDDTENYLIVREENQSKLTKKDFASDFQRMLFYAMPGVDHKIKIADIDYDAFISKEGNDYLMKINGDNREYVFEINPAEMRIVKISCYGNKFLPHEKRLELLYKLDISSPTEPIIIQPDLAAGKESDFPLDGIRKIVPVQLGLLREAYGAMCSDSQELTGDAFIPELYFPKLMKSLPKKITF